jgi:hypothetical protein
MRHYAASRMVAGSIPDDVNEFFQITQSFQPHYSLGFTQHPSEMSTGSVKIIFLESRALPVRKAENLSAICETTI